MKSSIVNLVTSWASLLSGGTLQDCQSPDDDSCIGGVAAVRALQRYDEITDGADSSVLIQLLDKDNAFVHMHPLGLSVNRLILNQIMGLDVFASSPAILLQNKVDYGVSSMDISDLQTNDMPLLLTNVGVPPQNSWYPYTRAVYFDEKTNLAIMSVSKSNEELNTPAVESTTGILRYIAKINDKNGCTSPTTNFFNNYSESLSLFHDNDTSCWVPVVYFSDERDEFLKFLDGMMQLNDEHKPALIIDTAGNFEEYSSPKLVDEVWIGSHRISQNYFFQHQLTISTNVNGSKLDNVTFITMPLSPLPDDAKDETYKYEISSIRAVADEALANNPVIGYSTAMPFARDSSQYRPCKSGECPIGNMIADAARWYADADIAFITSGGVRGPGWDAGEVTVSNIWDALPFPNTLCTGTMNGIHLFQLMNYSIGVATFEGVDTDDGGRLLQMSGMKVTYNTLLEGSRIISIDILNKDTDEYEPIERLKLYNFATDSFLCNAYTPFPEYLGDNLMLEGERQGSIRNELFQEILSVYMNETTTIGEPYDTTTLGRLVNDTSAYDILNLVQLESECTEGMYFDETILSCANCTSNVGVDLSKKTLEFEVSNGSVQSETETILLSNRDSRPVAIILKSVPTFVTVGSSFTFYKGADGPTVLEPDENIELFVTVDPSQHDPGTYFVSVSWDILDFEHPKCAGRVASIGVKMTVLPSNESNHLGSIRALGFALMGIILFTSTSFAVWVFCNRNQRVVRALQPIFLMTICAGVFIMGSAILPISIDDEIASLEDCSISCMSIPWLLCIGFTVAISALFAKLWRINILFESMNTMARVRVRAKDVAYPLVILFLLNFTVLFTWTFVSPIVYQRFEVDGQSWNTYGACVGSNKRATTVFLSILGILNIGALGIALYQAWKARNVSDEFSGETKTLFVALYSWVQLLVVGAPVLSLIDREETKARYFLFVTLLFAVCMSMLLIIFIPLFLQIRRMHALRKQSLNRPSSMITPSILRSSNVSTIRISGLNIVDQASPAGRVRFSGLDLDTIKERNSASCPNFQLPKKTIVETQGNASPPQATSSLQGSFENEHSSLQASILTTMDTLLETEAENEEDEPKRDE